MAAMSRRYSSSDHAGPHITRRAVERVLARPDVSPRTLRMRATALIRQVEDARRLYPWPALEQALLADAQALLRRAGQEPPAC